MGNEDVDKFTGFDWCWNVLQQVTLYHILVVIMVGFTGFIDGLHSTYPVFAQKKQDVRCPTGLDDYSGYNFTFSELLNITQVTIEEECMAYQVPVTDCSSSTLELPECLSALDKTGYSTLNCTSETVIFDTSQFTETVPSEFNLACGSFGNSIATSMSFVGLFIGSFLAGYCSDKWGRKITVIVAVACSGSFALLQAIVPGYLAFVTIRIFVQSANQAAYITYNVFAVEFVGPDARGYVGMIPNFLFAAGYVFMSLLSYLFPHWRHLTYAIAFLTLPFVLTWWLWPESPRWLYSMKRYDEGRKVLERFAKASKNVNYENVDSLNSTSGDKEDDFYATLKQKCEQVANSEEDEVETTNHTVLTLFTSGTPLLMVTLNFCFQFITIVMVYYGLIFSAGDLPGDIYMNNIINGLVEVAAYIPTFFLLQIWGRRVLLGGPLILAGVCMLLGMGLQLFIEAEWTVEFFRWLMFGAKLGVSGSFAVIWIYGAELFPTEIRGNALGLGSMVGRIGGICAPFVNEFWKTIPWLPPVIYGGFCIASGVLLFMLPETNGRPLLNTIAEANKFYENHSSKKENEEDSILMETK